MFTPWPEELRSIQDRNVLLPRIKHGKQPTAQLNVSGEAAGLAVAFEMAFSPRFATEASVQRKRSQFNFSRNHFLSQNEKQYVRNRPSGRFLAAQFH